jgi:hypothetical protein
MEADGELHSPAALLHGKDIGILYLHLSIYRIFTNERRFTKNCLPLPGMEKTPQTERNNTGPLAVANIWSSEWFVTLYLQSSFPYPVTPYI